MLRSGICQVGILVRNLFRGCASDVRANVDDAGGVYVSVRATSGVPSVGPSGGRRVLPHRVVAPQCNMGDGIC